MPTSIRRRIAVVDDNPSVAVSLAAFLKFLGHEVDVAHDGATAIDLARRSRPDFLFLDIGLPGLDGFEVAAALRRDPALQAMRIIAVTGRASEDDRQRSKEVGIDYYIVKPMGLEYIVSLVGNAAPRPQPI